MPPAGGFGLGADSPNDAPDRRRIDPRRHPFPTPPAETRQAVSPLDGALHYGSATCGNVGIDAQRDATIIGDAVNTVFRLEGVMKDSTSKRCSPPISRSTYRPASR